MPIETLLSDAYNDERRKLIHHNASLELRPGSVEGFGAVVKLKRAEGARDAVGAMGAGEPTVGRVGEVRGDTVHFDVVDRAGNMVSATPSGGWLQSSPVIPELGFCLGTRGQMFWLEEGHPASLAPGKRPRTTLSPTMALRDGEPYLAWGSPGRRPAGPVDDAVLPAPRPRQAQPPGGDRRAGLALRALPDLFLAAHGAARRARGGEPGARRRRKELEHRGHVVEVGPAWSEGRLTAASRVGPPPPRRRQPARHAGLCRRALSAPVSPRRIFKPDHPNRIDQTDHPNRIIVMIKLFAAALALVATLVAPALVAPAGAADYPSRPVTLIVAFTPGGPSDVLARIVGRQLEKILGQTFVIDNRPGGAGNIAAEVVANASPDGYTLLMGNNGLLATNQSLFQKLGFDGEKDFAPISLIGSQPNILVVNPSFRPGPWPS